MTKKLEGVLIREGALIKIWSLKGGANPREGAKPNKYGKSCFFPKLPQYPSDSKPTTVACSKFQFPFNCQKDTETAMRLT